MTNLGPHWEVGEGGGGVGLAPLDLSVREGDRKNHLARSLNCA